MRPIHWFMLAAGAALLTFGGAEVVKRVKRGKKLGGDNAYAGPDGFVPGSPATLATEVGVELGVYALARLISSEAGGLPEAGRAGVAWAAVNEARRRKISVFKLLGGDEAKFARQNVGGRFASTAEPPSRADLELAQAVLAGALPDPTGGATRWDSPRAQRALLAKKAKGYRKTPEDIARSRVAEGFEVVGVAGIDGDTLRFWRKRKSSGGLFS
jgi:hypothetical protein